MNQSALKDALTFKTDFTPTPDGKEIKIINQRLEAFQDAL